MKKIESILNRHANRVESLEEREAKKILRTYREARQSIKNSLLNTPDNTFTEAMLDSRLVQIEQGIKILEQKLNDKIYFGFETITEQGIEDSVNEVNKLEKHFTGVSAAIPLDVILESTDRKNFLFNQYKSSIHAYNSSMRNGMQKIMTNGLTANKNWSQIVMDIDNAFHLNEYKIARIVRTELHNIYNVSKMEGFKNSRDKYLPDLKKALFHPMDLRTGKDSKKAAMDLKPVDIDKPFQYEYNGKTISFMAPPDRPNDRAILMPWRSDYAKI